IEARGLDTERAGRSAAHDRSRHRCDLHRPAGCVIETHGGIMKTLRLIGIVAAVLLLSVPAISAVTTIAIPENGDAILLPQGSPLHFHKFGPEHAVEFDGAIELTGTWYYGDNQINDTNAADPTVYFVPDKVSFARLPRFKLRGQPGSIYLTNENDLVKAVVSK